jgi:lysozyme family protein
VKDSSFKISGVEGSGTARHEDSVGSVPKTVKKSFDSVLKTSLGEINSKPVALGKSLFRDEIPALSSYRTQSADNGFRSSLDMVLKYEGKGYVKNDAQKGPSRMGILQSTAREYGYTGNVRNITPAQTEAIYKKIWEKSGASKLPYPLSAVHFDTYVNSPAAARKLLKQSDGDVDTYLSLRAERYSRLAAVKPEKYAKYLKGWMNRVNSLRNMVAAYEKVSDTGKG